MKGIRIMSMAGLLAFTMFINQECQSQTPAQAPAAAPAPAAGAPAAAPAAGGTSSIKVKATYTGTPPPMAKLKREADPFCAKTPMTDQEVVVNPNGTLKNVAVRVVKGAAPIATAPAQPVMMTQSNCMYEPRVSAGMTNQKLVIKNSDPILHNVHTYVGAATGFNQAQMKGSKDIEKVVTAGVTKFKCDVHPWMTGYVVGNDNPYVCVTDATGECTISVPAAGAYSIEAWHEKYGAKTADVTVAAGQPASVAVSYVAQ